MKIIIIGVVIIIVDTQIGQKRSFLTNLYMLRGLLIFPFSKKIGNLQNNKDCPLLWYQCSACHINFNFKSS